MPAWADEFILTLIQEFEIVLNETVVVNGNLATPPPDITYYAILFVVLVFLVFEHRKILLILYFLLAFLMFGIPGVVVSIFFWIVMYPVNLAFDFFDGDRKFI